MSEFEICKELKEFLAQTSKAVAVQRELSHQKIREVNVASEMLIIEE